MSLTDPIFIDETKAREHFEAIRWPNGPYCPHCGETERVYRLNGKSHRPGLLHCNSCNEAFTVTVGTVMERSHVPLNKWALAFRLMCSSKKGISAHQLHRTLDVTYKTAWFMAHRIREAMRQQAPEGQLGGLKAEIDKGSYVMTDDSAVYPPIAGEFDGHGTVNHSIEEYVRGGFWRTNTVEGYFSILKRGVIGTYHHVSPEHMKRYLGGFDFRHNERAALGVDDSQRTTKAIKGADGKRLTYRTTSGGSAAIPF